MYTNPAADGRLRGMRTRYRLLVIGFAGLCIQPVWFSAAESSNRVSVADFKDQRPGATDEALGRIVPLILSARLQSAGASVRAAQGTEFSYLEWMIRQGGFSVPAGETAIESQAPVQRLVEGTIDMPVAGILHIAWRLIDLTRADTFSIIHESIDAIDAVTGMDSIVVEMVRRGDIEIAPDPALPENPVVVVGGFPVDQTIPSEVSWMAEDLVAVTIQDMPQVSVVERRRIREVEKEMSLALSGLSDLGRSRALGLLTGANLMLMGAATRIDQSYVYAVLLARVESGEIVRGLIGSTDTFTDLPASAARHAARLFTGSAGTDRSATRADTHAEFSGESVYALYRAVGLFDRAQLFSGASGLESALSEVDRSLLLNPGNPAARYLRGKILVKLKRFEEATDEFRLVIQRDTTDRVVDPSAGVWAAECHKELGDRYFYWREERPEPPRTGQAMTAHYLVSAVGFPGSFGSWESMIKLAQIYSPNHIPDTVAIPVFENLIAAHPDWRNTVFYQWAGRLRRDESPPVRWKKLQDILARMDLKGWWHFYRVLWLNFDSVGENEEKIPDSVTRERKRWTALAFGAAEEVEGKLLLASCLDEAEPLVGLTAGEWTDRLGRDLVRRTEERIARTLSAEGVTSQERAAVLYQGTRKMAMIFPHVPLPAIWDAMTMAFNAILRNFPDESPFPVYAVEDLIAVAQKAYREGKWPGEATAEAESYVLSRPHLPDRKGVLAKLIKLNLLREEWTRAGRLIDAFQMHADLTDAEKREMKEFKIARDRRTKFSGGWSGSDRFRSRDFLVRYARPPFNFQVR